MIKMLRKEFLEGNLCVRTYYITFLGIPIFKAKITSTNNVAARQLIPISENNKVSITGFNICNNEIKDKSKKN